MRRARWTLAAAVIGLVAAFGLGPAQATSHGETHVVAAGAAVFPDGTTFNGLPVSGSTFGFGVLIGGSTEGDVVVTLAGTSVLGEPQEVTLAGKVTTGAVNGPGSVTFSGTGALDLGTGAAPTEVPFLVTATTDGLTLAVAGTELPTQALTNGSIDIG
jgi:hypothetical protein